MAVYTDVSFEDLEACLKAYDVGTPKSFKGIAEGVENSNFLLQTDRGAFVVTLYEKRVSAADLPFFLGLMEHLAQHGVSCPQPVRTKDGAQWVTLNGRSAAILTYLDGVSLRRPEVAQCAEAGIALAKVHDAGHDFLLQRPNALSLAGWRKLADATVAKADTVAKGLSAAISKSLGQIERDWPLGLPSGIIHADLFPDNVLFMGGRITGLIDFYFACNDSFAYDLAVMLNAWCFEPDGSFNITKSKALVSAYRQQRTLGADEIAVLPLLARGAALRFLLTRLYDWLNPDPLALVRPKDPREFAKKLRFHMQIKSPAEYGL
jgi:homoserine kinase type II